MRGILSVVLSANTSVRLARDGAAHVAGIGHRLNGKPAFNHVVRQGRDIVLGDFACELLALGTTW
jgi:hypothetical protein